MSENESSDRDEKQSEFDDSQSSSAQSGQTDSSSSAVEDDSETATRSEPSKSDHELDELLGDREITEEADPSEPQRTDDPSIEYQGPSDHPLPLTVITQTKNHRELLDYFLTADIPDEGYNKTTISEQSGVTTNGIRRHIDTFLDFGIVERTTDEDAHISRYTTNQDSDVHRALRMVNNVLADTYYDE